MPYVVLNYVKNIRVRGELKTFQAGDTVNVGKQTALEWIIDGTAKDPFGQMGPPIIPKDTTEFGIVAVAKKGSVPLGGLGVYAKTLPITYGLPKVTHKYTCIWSPAKRVTPSMLNYGFLRVLDTWEMAAMLKSLTQQAGDIGSPKEQARTLKAVGSLKLPIYDARLVWVRRTEASVAVIKQWCTEVQRKADTYHSFLRALYANKAMMCTLPMDWID